MSEPKSNYSITKEEVIFYLDLSTDFAWGRRVRKGIKEFMSEYNELKQLVTYGIVLFKKNKEIFSLFDAHQEKILDTIKELWDEREMGLSYFENGLYYILAYIFKKSRTEPHVYRVIVLSDKPSSQTNEYHSALYNLVLKCKNFSTYIDIIRLGDQKFYEDDVKLKIIASEAFGGVLYCQDDKNLNTYLTSLTESRKDHSIRQSSMEDIDTDSIPFYERLATDLISLTSEDQKLCLVCEDELCQICESPNDILRKCYNCNGAFHHCCAAKYSLNNNIGIPYIFRCPNCGALLKIEKEFVMPHIEKEKRKPKPEQTRNPFLLDKEQSLTTESRSREVEEEQRSEPQADEPKERKIKIGGFFGNEIVIRKDGSTKVSKQKVETGSSENLLEEEKEEQISITSLNPPRPEQTLKFCPVCGEAVKGSPFCPHCGSDLG